ncbi:MAG: sugar ABC transporter permease [Actinomycetota bacterium]|nr:sugar ABC transporter permease [Actinomycetota bacterium]
MSMPSQQLGKQEVAQAPPRRSAAAVQEERVAFLFLLPWFAGLFLFIAVPLVYSLYVSMTDRRLISADKPQFVGLENYTYMFTRDAFFYKTLFVTMKWILLSTPLLLVAGLVISLFLNQKYFGMNVFRTILFIPSVVSGVAVSVLWLQLLNPELGVVNYVLIELGVDNPPYWLEDPQWAMPAVILMELWTVGGMAIIYLAGLQNVPPHLYEAATIDGAGAWNKFRHITLPMLSPTIFFLLLNAIIGSLLFFGPLFVLTGGTGGGGPENSLLFYMIYLYRVAFVQGFMGYGTALAWILTILGVLMVVIMIRLERRFVFYESED